MNNQPRRPIHSLASLQYLGSLIAGRRVLVVGMAEQAADHARELGARRVCIAANPKQAESFTRPDIEILATDPERMELRSGAFDVALVLDLPAFEDPPAVLGEAMRIVGLKGHVVVALRNPSCETPLCAEQAANLDYYQAYDMLSGLFPSVQMVGQSPFIGYAVADLSFDGPDLPVSFDGSLLGDAAEEIEWFLAVCGQTPAPLDPYTVVQVPLVELRLTQPAGPDLSATVSELEQELKAARLELSTRGVKIESLQKDLEKELMASEAARARGVELAKQLDDERKAKQRAEIEGEYSRRSQTFDRPQDPEWFTKLRQAEERARVAENARDELVLRLRSDAAELERLRKAQEDNEAKSRRTASQLEELSKKVTAAEKELAEAREKLAASVKRDEPARAEQVAAVRQAEERARSAEASRDALLEQMRADAAELERLRQRYDDLKDKGKRLEQEKAQAVQKSDELRAKVSQLETQLKLSQEEAERAKAQAVEDARSPQQTAPDTDELKEARKECADLERRLAQVAEEKSSLKLELERQTTIVRDLSVELNRVQTMARGPAASERPTDDDVEQELARLRGALSGQHRARVEAELSAATLQVERDRLQMELLARDAELVALRRPSREAPPTNSALIERDYRIAELESELQSAKWRAAELEARNAELMRQAAAVPPPSPEPDTTLLNERDAAIDLCRRLERELEQARAEQQKLSQTLSALERTNRRLEEEVDSRRARQERLSETHATCKARLESLEQEVSNAAEQRRVLENELARLQEQIAAHTGEPEQQDRQTISREIELKERIHRLEAELAAAVDAHARAKEARDAVTAEVRRELLAELQVEQRVAERQAEQKVAELEATIIELRGKLAQQNEWSHDAGADAARLSGELSELAAQCAAMEQELRERLASEAAMERALAVLRQDAVEMWRAPATRACEPKAAAPTQDHDARWLSEQLAKEKERAGALMRELTQVSGQCNELARQYAQAQQERDALAQRMTELESEQRAATQAAERARHLLAETEEKLAAAQRARAATSEQLADALTELDSLGRGRSPALAEAELEARRKELQELRAKLDEVASQAAEKESLVASLTEQLEERERRAASLEKEVAHLLETTKEHESDIAAWEMELKFRNARIAQLESELSKFQSEEPRG